MAVGVRAILSGFVVTLIYGAFHVFLVFLLALTITIKTKAQGDSISFKKFIQKVWYLRGVFTPLLIHIYDTATDIGVLYEWYFLAEYEKQEGNNIESLDMELLFKVGLIFMLVYRGLLGLLGGIGMTVIGVINGDCMDDISSNCCLQSIINFFWMCFSFIFGFLMGALELGVFVAIYNDQEEHFNSNKSNASDEIVYKPGTFQKTVQLAEGILESMPEVILQSVFIIRSYNSSYLLNNEGTVFGLIVLSIIASICSIANKYVWIDQEMVDECAESLFFKKTLGNSYAVSDYSKLLERYGNGEHIVSPFDSDKSNAFAYVLVYHGEYCVEYDELSGEGSGSAKNDFKIDPNWLNNRAANVFTSNKERLAQEQAIVEGARLIKQYDFNLSLENLDKQGTEKMNEVIEELNILIENWNNNDDLRHEMIKHLSKIDQRRIYLAYNVACHKKYYFSIGYIIRVIWRLAAVTSRFVIFSLIWVVLGGAFEVVLVPTMIFVWYLVIILYLNAQCGLEIENKRMSCVGTKRLCSPILEAFLDTQCWADCCCDSIFCHSCALFWQIIFFIIGFCLFGITFQLGILGIAGRALYTFRMIENVILFGIIVLFAFDKGIDCEYCADPIYRNVYENERIKIWLIIGGISIITHIVSSFVVSTLIDDDYAFNCTKIIEDDLEDIKKERNSKKEKTVELAINLNSVS